MINRLLILCSVVTASVAAPALTKPLGLEASSATAPDEIRSLNGAALDVHRLDDATALQTFASSSPSTTIVATTSTSSKHNRKSGRGARHHTWLDVHLGEIATGAAAALFALTVLVAARAVVHPKLRFTAEDVDRLAINDAVCEDDGVVDDEVPLLNGAHPVKCYTDV
eukprot:m.77854 g.77854  ORF g.77854 m.77854 type:complete len:168 (-) comp9166_c0_seq4:160-663(-)